MTHHCQHGQGSRGSIGRRGCHTIAKEESLWTRPVYKMCPHTLQTGHAPSRRLGGCTACVSRCTDSRTVHAFAPSVLAASVYIGWMERASCSHRDPAATDASRVSCAACAYCGAAFVGRTETMRHVVQRPTLLQTRRSLHICCTCGARVSERPAPTSVRAAGARGRGESTNRSVSHGLSTLSLHLQYVTGRIPV